MKIVAAVGAVMRLAAAEGAQQAKNPILPAWNEVIWGGLSFIVLLFLMWKYAMPALTKAMAARSDKISGDLKAAENARAEADVHLADYKAQLADAKAESNRIIDDARQQADAVRKDLVARAESDAAQIRAKATEDLNLQADRIKADLTSHVKNLSLELAEKVVGQNMTTDANAALIDRYIAELSNK